MHLRAGGRSRINEYKEAVIQAEEVIQDIMLPKCQFWTLQSYKEEYGDPKSNRAKVVVRKVVTKSGKVKMERWGLVTHWDLHLRV